MSAISPAARAANCLAAADTLWHRCERGVDIAFPPPDEPDRPERRRRAARLLLKLVEAGGRLAMTAREADPAAYAAWRAARQERYSDAGWTWPPSPEVASQTRMDLIQTAWPEAHA